MRALFLTCSIFLCTSCTATPPGTNTSDIQTAAVPSVTYEPRYPLVAFQNKIEGWIKVKFDVEADGSLSNIQPIDSEPAGMWDEVTIQAMTQWKFKPATVNGKPVRKTGFKYTISFVLPESLDTLNPKVDP